MNLSIVSRPEGCGDCKRVLGVVETEAKYGEVKTMACAAGILRLSNNILCSSRMMSEAAETSTQFKVNGSIVADAEDAQIVIRSSQVISMCSKLVSVTGTAIEVELGQKDHIAGVGDNSFAQTRPDVLGAATTLASIVQG